MKSSLLFFTISLFGTILLGGIGFIFGANYATNYVPELFGLRGYESSGALFSFIGTSLGASLAPFLFRKYFEKEFPFSKSILLLGIFSLVFQIITLQLIGVNFMAQNILFLFPGFFIPFSLKKIQKKWKEEKTR